MIVVTGRMKIDPRDRERALAVFQEVAALSRREEGCDAYAISIDVDEPETFRVFEEWASREHLAAHLGAPHIARFMAAMAEVRVLETSIVRYEAVGRRRLL